MTLRAATFGAALVPEQVRGGQCEFDVDQLVFGGRPAHGEFTEPLGCDPDADIGEATTQPARLAAAAA